MRELYDRLRTGGEMAFQALHDGRMEEDLQLDFKRKGSPDRPGLSGDDKSRIGEALSGFSNSAGGLLVLGVDCRNGGDGVDCVQGLEPFTGPARIASDIRSMLGSLLQPSNDGIEIAHVESDARPGFGYVLIWVPRSERRPHQSRASGHFRYYKRIGRDFHPMEHYELDDQFSRAVSPNLELEFVSARPDNLLDTFTVHRIICAHNTSDVIAKFPFIKIWELHNIHVSYLGLNGNGRQGLKEIQLQSTYQFLGGADDVIHPGDLFQVARLSSVFQKRDNRWITGTDIGDAATAKFQFRIGCEGMRSVVDRREFPAIKGYSLPI